MIRTSPKLILLAMLCYVNSNAQSSENINFKAISFDSIQIESSLQERPSFTYFHSVNCLSCQTSDHTTFKDPQLVSFANENFVAAKVDIHSALGEEWSREFQITCLPTMLIFNKDGSLLGRYETVLTTSTFSQILKSAITLSSETNSPNNNENTGQINMESMIFQREPLTNEVIEQLSFLLEKSSLNDSSGKREYEQEYLYSLFPQKDITKISTTLLELADADTSALFSLNEADFQELLNHPKQMNFLIQDLKASLGPDPLDEMVVAPFIGQEREMEQVDISNIHNSAMKPTTVSRLIINGHYKIRFGSYANYDSAASLIKQLSAISGKKLYLLIAKKGRYTTYDIMTEDFDNQQEAADFLELLETFDY